MGRLLRAPLTWVVAALATAGAVLLISGGGDGDEGGSSPQPPALPAAPTDAARKPHHHEKTGHGHHQRTRNDTRAAVREAVTDTQRAQLDEEERRAAGVVRAYVAGLSARDGRRVCGLFAPGATSVVDFPRGRPGCAESLSASIGYRDPRGFPVYEDSRVARIGSVAIKDADARVVATTVTRFAGDREPSIEDDVVYLRELDGRWVIVKPSAALYRAIGVGNIPPSVLAPP